MNRAHQLVEALLDEAFQPDYSDPTGVDWKAEGDKAEHEFLMRNQDRLKREEREVGIKTQREMSAKDGWTPAEEPPRKIKSPQHGSNRRLARNYWNAPQPPQAQRAVYQTDKGYVTQTAKPKGPAAQPANQGGAPKPSANQFFQIKGSKKYQPKHFAMPKPWKNWK
jgi:hypothetical protein